MRLLARPDRIDREYAEPSQTVRRSRGVRVLGQMASSTISASVTATRGVDSRRPGVEAVEGVEAGEQPERVGGGVGIEVMSQLVVVGQVASELDHAAGAALLQSLDRDRDRGPRRS